MTITGILAVAFFGFAFVLLWTDEIAAGPLIASHLPTDFWLVVGTLVASAAWYVGNRIYRRRQGVDISLAFREIPIE